MILGLGLDLVEVERVRAAVERQGEAFIERVLTPDEAAYCRFQAEPSIHIAARFAAKEAFSKAIGTGIGEGAGWRDIEVVRRDSGKPELVLHGKALESAPAAPKTNHCSMQQHFSRSSPMCRPMPWPATGCSP